MGTLGDVLGDEFEEEYESTVQNRRESANKVDTDTLKRICYTAIHEKKFKGEQPRFTFDDGSVDHNVFLMESPRNDIHKFQHELGEDGMSLGMFHVGELMSCAFNKELVELVDKINEDEHYLVVGRYTEKTVTKDGEERTYKNISPVRGILPLSKAKKLADDYANTASGMSMEEQAEEQQKEGQEDESSDDSSSADSSGPHTEQVVNIFKQVAQKNEDVMRAVADGDSDMLDKLTNVVNSNIDADVSSETVADIFEDKIESIDGRHEEEDDDDGFDMGDLGGSGDDEPEETTSDDEPEETETKASSDDDDESGDEDPSDWFN